MIIDEKKVIAESKSYTKGYKGMFPTNKRGKFQKNGKMQFIRIAIGAFIALAFAVGTFGLIYTLISEGGKAVERITEEQNTKPQYIEVIYKPQNAK